jgi:hypothetical protein
MAKCCTSPILAYNILSDLQKEKYKTLLTTKNLNNVKNSFLLHSLCQNQKPPTHSNAKL